MPGQGVKVMDLWHTAEADPSAMHTRIVTRQVSEVEPFAGHARADAQAGSDFIFDGYGMRVDDENVMAFPVVSAEASAVLAHPVKGIAGSKKLLHPDIVLVAAVQGRNNARVVLGGSLWAWSDEAVAASKANAEIVQAATAWALQERGVLRIAAVRHSKADGTPAQKLLHPKEPSTLPKSMFPEPEASADSLVYRVNDDLAYAVDIQRWESETGQWAPYSADDLQLEFVMLDPYVRTALQDQGNGTFGVQFRAPDKYGIFKFRLQYRRAGLTVLHDEQQVSVTPLWHDEYPRFLVVAYPYYTVLGLLGTVFLVLSAVMLHGRFPADAGKKQKTE